MRHLATWPFLTLGVLFLSGPGLAAGQQAPAAPGSAADAHQKRHEAEDQDPGIQFTDSVTVTANKREQDLQDVGISVTALDGATLREGGITTTTDLAQQVPNIYLQDFFGGAGTMVNASIRGMGLNDFNPGTEASSVLYVDEFYVSPLLAGSILLHDAQRVEVLRGPQGTLFGRNTTGGAIHYVTNDPTSTTDAFGMASFGAYGLRRFDGAANVALGDRAAVRVSFMSDNNGAWAHNVGDGPDGHEKRLNSVRGQLRVDITEQLSSTTKVTFGRATGLFALRQGDLAEGFDERGFLIATSPGPFLTPEASSDFTLGQTNRPDELDSTSVLAVQRFDWELGSVTLTSVTGYLDLDQSHIQDCDGTPLDSCLDEFPYDARELTQEVRATGRAGRTQWTVGAFFFNQDSTSDQAAALDLDGQLGGGVPGFGFGGPFFFDVDWAEEKSAWATFGQMEFDVTNRVTLIAGMRYSRDKKDFDFVKRDYVAVPGSVGDRDLSPINLYPGVYIEGIGANINFSPDGPPLPIDTNFDLVPDTLLPPAGSLTRYRDNLIDGKLGVNWKATDDFLLYGSWTRGTKAGGFNNGFVSALSNDEIPFGAETLDAFEVGFRSIGFGRSTRLSGGVFHYDFDDYQAVAFEGLGTRTLNRPASSTGGELELVSNFYSGWESRLGVGLLDTRVRDISNGTTTFDAEMGLAARASINGVLRYARPIGTRVLVLQTETSYVADQFQDVLNDPGVVIPSHTVGNVRVSFLGADGRWEVAAWVQNIMNAGVPNSRYNLNFGSIISTYRPPRWFGTGLTFRFN